MTTGPLSFEDFQAQKNGAAGSSGGGTVNETTESVSSPMLGNGFGLTGPSPMSGISTPDRIDTDDRNLLLTTSVGVQSLPAEQMATLQAQLARAGLTPSTYVPTGTLDDDTRKALLELKRTASASGMSDLDTLRTQIETQAQAAVGAFGSDFATGDGAGRSVSKQIQEPVFTDPLTARGVLRDAMTARLGRAPTADEYHQFRHLLSNSEGGQDVITQVTTRDGNGGSKTRIKRSDNTTDPSAEDVADDYLSRGKLGKEGNTVQAANYFDIIARKVGGI